jgi:hypothetical protein
MTNQHRATPDDWAQQEDWANRSAFSDSSCIIELRDRVEALEVLIHELQTMHNTAVDWRMEQDHRLNQLKATQHAHAGAPFPVTPPNCRQRLLRDGKPYPKSGCEACGSLSPMWRQCNAALVALEPTTQPPAGSLVDRIATDAELCQVYNDAPEHGFGPALRAVYDLGREHGAAPVRSGPESPLLDRVADAIGAADDEGLTNMTWSNHSHAAILEVAAWLKEEGYSTLQAEALEQEANQ